MALNTKTSFPNWIHYFDTLDSTNNYAMQMIDDGMAYHGNVVWAKKQTQGKGQRGKHWQDEESNLKMSLIVKPLIPSHHTFHLSVVCSLVITNYLKTILPETCQVAIKWPNDIYINDKKACGVLIENVFRGMNWNFAVIGIGLNIGQTSFSKEMNKATSIKIESGWDFEMLEIVKDLRAGILNALHSYSGHFNDMFGDYQNLLHKKNEYVNFKDIETDEMFTAVVERVAEDGQLVLIKSGQISYYGFGSIQWLL